MVKDLGTMLYFCWYKIVHRMSNLVAYYEEKIKSCLD